MRRPSNEYDLPEILVHRDEHTPLLGSPLQKNPVPGVGATFPRFKDFVSLLTQPVREATASAPVNEESHLAPT